MSAETTGPRYASSGPIAITGALGFVASHLIPHLTRRDARVIAVVRPGRDASRLERLGLEIRRADLERPESLGGAFDDARAIVHLSGMAQVTRLVPALVASGVERGVFVSSAGVYTHLESASADAKRTGEEALRRSPIDYTILRPSMIYGTAADRNMIRLLRWIRSYPMVFVPGDGRTPQQPVHVDDLVAAILAALERPAAARREYDVGGPESHTLRDVIQICAGALGRNVHIVSVPLRPAHGAILLLRRLGLPTPVRPEQVLRLMESKAVDIGPALRELDFRPRPFVEGIRDEAKDLPPER